MEYSPHEVWTEENRPEDHPLYERQVALEMEMMTTGRDSFRAATNKAREREAMSSLGPYRKVLQEYVEPMAAGIHKWKEDHVAAPRRKPTALKPLLMISDEVAALIALRCTLDRLASGTAKISSVALNIGQAVEYEARIAAWEKADPDLFAAIQHTLSVQKATAVHRRRVNINRFNMKVRNEVGWENWPIDLKRHIGFALIDLMITSTQRFAIISDPEWDPKTARKGWARPKVLKADDELIAWITDAMSREEVFHPFFMPTLIPPCHWTTLKDGGYHTDLIPHRFMIRFKADHEEQRRVAIEDLSAVYMPEVYESLNTIQNVPWRINQAVFEVAEKVKENDLAIAKIPAKRETPLPYISEEDKLDATLLKQWKIKAAKVWGENARRVSRIVKSDRTLRIARKFKDDEFYFPHVLDFRGRMYPLPVDLNPQGEDLARGLLTFSNAKPVDEEASRWLAIQVCNTSGNDKIPFEERVEWTHARNDLWLRIAEDPLGNREWCIPKPLPGAVDEPWQHLAAILEWARYLREGPGMMSALPVRIDGTCNGIQHLSAMVRDEVGGAAVNLIPSDRPRDIYKEIANLVAAKLKEISEGDESLWTDEALGTRVSPYVRKHGTPKPTPEMKAQDKADKILELRARNIQGKKDAALWLEALGGDVPRKLTKRPVMILPYGGSRHAYFGYTVEWMDEEDPDGILFPEERRGRLARFLTNVMWDVIEAQLYKPREVQIWLQDLAKAACMTGAPITWTTPVDFVVRHFYGQREMRQIETKIDGQRLKLVDWTTTATLSTEDQVRGIAPNFTHSMDAAALMECILEANEKGVTSITSIHDAYGTVAADVDLLNACLRRAFVTLYENDILGDFEANIVRMVAGHPSGAEGELPPFRPTPGKLDIETVLHSDYFFA